VLHVAPRGHPRLVSRLRTETASARGNSRGSDVPRRWSQAHRVKVYLGAVCKSAAHAVEGVQVPLPASVVQPFGIAHDMLVCSCIASVT
jgi:hypothetical protein